MIRNKALKALADFVDICEINNVDLFYSYHPHTNQLDISIFNTGKWLKDFDNEITLDQSVYLGYHNVDFELSNIIKLITDKYFKK
jgi:hypothetical protein